MSLYEFLTQFKAYGISSQEYHPELGMIKHKTQLHTTFLNTYTGKNIHSDLNHTENGMRCYMVWIALRPRVNSELQYYVVSAFILGVVHLHTPISHESPSIAHLPSLSPHPLGIAVSRAFSRPSGCRIRRPAVQVWPSGYSREEDARIRTNETI